MSVACQYVRAINRSASGFPNELVIAAYARGPAVSWAARVRAHELATIGNIRPSVCLPVSLSVTLALSENGACYDHEILITDIPYTTIGIIICAQKMRIN